MAVEVLQSNGLLQHFPLLQDLIKETPPSKVPASDRKQEENINLDLKEPIKLDVIERVLPVSMHGPK